MTIINYKDNKDIRKDIEPLYVSAFPIDERPPVKYFFLSLENNANNLYAIYKEEFIGFYYTTIYKDICYIFFLAIQEKYRHQGYGSKIITLIKDQYPNHVLLLCYEEVDERYEDYENRAKREEFYTKNGFKNNNLKTNEYGVIYQTAYYGAHTIPFSDYLEIFKLGFGNRSEKYIKEYT